MESNITAMDIIDKIYSTNKETLLEFITDLKEISCYIKNERTLKKLENVIINLNKFINDYKKKINILHNSLKGLTDMKKPKKKEIDKYKNGKYIGEMENGERNGKGIYIFKDGETYDGEWKDNLKNGRGIYCFNNGDIYEGEWKDDKCEGKGIYYFANGDIYDGYYFEDEMHGKGVYYYINGNRYEGDWKKGKKHGQGIFYYFYGDRKMGNYSHGIGTGKHVTLTKSGNILTYDY